MWRSARLWCAVALCAVFVIHGHRVAGTSLAECVTGVVFQTFWNCEQQERERGVCWRQFLKSTGSFHAFPIGFWTLEPCCWWELVLDRETRGGSAQVRSQCRCWICEIARFSLCGSEYDWISTDWSILRVSRLEFRMPLLSSTGHYRNYCRFSTWNHPWPVVEGWNFVFLRHGIFCVVVKDCVGLNLTIVKHSKYGHMEKTNFNKLSSDTGIQEINVQNFTSICSFWRNPWPSEIMAPAKA